MITTCAQRPLQGIRVLDLTRALSGLFAAMILGDLGATVVKVEPSEGGDMTRTWGPFAAGQSAYYLSANRSKRSLALDFRHPERPAGDEDTLGAVAAAMFLRRRRCHQ